MKVKQLELTNYRNYVNQSLDFSDHINIFIGNNAQGKTNLLESLYVLAMTKSHRTHNEKELVHEGDSQAKISGTIERRLGNLSLEIDISNKGRKTKVNGLEQSKLSQYIGQLNAVLFSPEDLSLVKGSPNLRRKFVDMDLGQINPIYLHYLSQYRAVLKQRNYYLKHQSHSIDETYLDVLDEQLVQYGASVIQLRAQFIQHLSEKAAVLHSNISSHHEQLNIRYVGNVSCETLTDLQSIKATFLQKLKESRQRDLMQKMTTSGPHRDDLQFLINDKDVRIYGSQGQQRLTVLSMKIAEIDVMEEETGEYPILLLDDVMSELDNERQLKLMQTIEDKVQTFITTTTLEHLPRDMKVNPTIFKVDSGCVVEEKEGQTDDGRE